MSKTPKKKLTPERVLEVSADEFVRVHDHLDRLDGKVESGFAEMRAGFQEMRLLKHDIIDAVTAIHDVRVEELQKEVKKLKQHVGLK